MTLTLTISADLESRLAGEAAALGIPVETYALEVLEQGRASERRGVILATELQAWATSVSSEPPGDELLQQLDADRLSDRSLYPSELKGQTW